MFSLHQLLLLQVLTGLGPNALGSKIINGDIAPPNTLQFMVSVQVRGKHVCGGFLIRDDFVVTAAHCDRHKPTHVVVGTHDLTRVGENRIEIQKKYKHPAYKNVKRGDDVMLLKLARKVQLGNTIHTIQLSTGSPTENERCTVAGWGYTTTGGNTVDQLRVVDVSVINLSVCSTKWNGIPNNVICAGGYGTNKGACRGDSGGPLVCNNRASGIVSYNYNCSYPNLPNVHADVSRYNNWIQGKLNSVKNE